MTELMKFYRKFGAWLGVACLGLLLSSAWGQAAGQPTSTPQQNTTDQKNAGEGARATQDGAAGQLTVEKKISPQEAQELFHEVDEILKFSSQDSALPIKHEVKRRLTNRDDLVAYMTKHMSDDEDAKRLRRSELVLKKFGLLPHDFDLSSFLVALLKEQVAGYYDPKTKTVNLLDWVSLDQQRPVLAHELTHALQDQSFGLEKWMKAGDSELVERRSEPTPADIENDEISTARQAVVEGQAMVVLLDYMLAASNRTLVDSPEVAEALKQGMIAGTEDAPKFRDAPIFIKEELTFPYRYGLDFEVALLKHGGKAKAYAGAFTDPPHSSRQIMEPQTYLSGEHIEPMALPDFKQDFKNYDKFDIGAMGEFDVAILIDQYAGDTASHELYPHWRGGYYYAVQPKGQASSSSPSSSSIGLLYVSRWATAENAADFAAIYAKSLAKRYEHVHGVEQAGQKTLEADDFATLQSLTGLHAWMTEEGNVSIEAQGDTVMIAESLDKDTTKMLEGEVFAVPAK